MFDDDKEANHADRAGLSQLEQQNQRIERKNRCLTAALTLMVVAMCAVVTVAAKGEKHGDFDSVVAQDILVMNDAGMPVVTQGADDDGNGLFYTLSAQAKDLVILTSTENGCAVKTYHPSGKDLVTLSANENGDGVVQTKSANGKELVTLSANENSDGVVQTKSAKGKELAVLTSTENGGYVEVYNKTGEGIVTMKADEYGNGVVGAYNRKGIGRDAPAAGEPVYARTHATYPKREARSAWQADQTTPSPFMPNTRIGIPNSSLPTSSKGDF